MTKIWTIEPSIMLQMKVMWLSCNVWYIL